MDGKGNRWKHLPITSKAAICVHIPGVSENKSDEKVIRLSLESCKNNAKCELNQEPATEVKRLLNSVCSNCLQLRNQLEFKNEIIRDLNNERDSIKVNLTQLQNKNVELEMKLQKYRKERRLQSCSKKHKRDAPCSLDVQSMRERCLELEEINKHLQQHLTRLRKVFADIKHSDSDEVINSKSKSSDTVISIEKTKSNDSSVNSSKMSSLIENRTKFDGFAEKEIED